MSRTIDERVVSMQFDNRQFEANVNETMSSLDKLKQRLNLTGAAKGLQEVDAASKKVDMSPLSAGVEAVQVKFSALQVMATTALANITNSAVNAGKRIVSAFTIDPIKTGLAEYETQINAVQTILANTESKGTTLKDVNGALDTLNAYADKTIYNFTEMTRNIGTFTAAGIDLDTSVNAIQGIANLAAVSGSTSQQASTAMYQLSQALSSGTVKLMDWNSVVNAGMGGQVFQDALKETARVHGIAIDDMIEEEGSFRETLSNGWLSSEILTETLQKFTLTTEGLTKEQIEANREMLRGKGYTEEQIDEIFKLGETATNAATKVKTFSQLMDTLKESAQSGWTQTWEILIGDFEEAKELWTNVSDTLGGIINAMSESRNKLLQGWADEGGRGMMLDSFKNLFNALVSIVKPIKEAFRDIFPPTTVNQLLKLTEGLKNFTAKLTLSDTASENLKRTFKGLFAIFSIVGKVISSLFTAIKPLFGGVTDLGGGVLGVTAAIGDFIVRINDAIGKSGILTKVTKGLAAVFKFLAKVLGGVIDVIGDIFGGISDVVSGFGSQVSAEFNAIGEGIEGSLFVKVLKGVWTFVETATKGIINVIKGIGEGIGNVLSNGGASNLLDIINKIIAGGVGVGLIKFISSLKDGIEGISGITDGFIDILDSVKGCFEAYQQDLQAKTLLKIATAIAILVASILVLSMIDSNKLYDSLIAIAALFGLLIGSMALISKSITKTTGFVKIGTSMLIMSAAILILSAALKTVSDLDIGSITNGLIAIAGLSAIMVTTAVALDKAGKPVIKGAAKMVIFAAAIKILASVCEDLAYLRPEDLLKSMLAISALSAIMVTTAIAIDKAGDPAIKGATKMVIFAAAMKVLASACSDFASMTWEDLSRGLTGLAVALTAVVVAIRLLPHDILADSIGLIAVAAAMKILASVVKDLGSLNTKELVTGLVGLAGSLTAVVVAMRLLPKDILKDSIGLIAAATAILILSNAMIRLGGMSWEAVGKGLVSLGGSLLILAVGLRAMKGTLAGSGALTVAALALGLLTPTLLILGGMSWEAIAKGLITVAGAFAILGTAGLLLKPLVPAILGLSGALALVGAGIALAGIGLAAMGAGLMAIAVGVTTLAASLDVVIAVVAGIIAGVCKGIAEGIVAFCGIIIDGAPAIGQAIIVLVKTACEVILETIPTIVNTVLELALALLDALARNAPQIVTSLVKLLVGIINSLGDSIPELLVAVMNFLGKLFDAIIDALSRVDPDSLLKMVTSIGIISALMIALSYLSSLVPAAMKGILALGVLIAELALVLAAIGALAQIPGIEWLISEGGNLLEVIGTAIGQFVGGIIGGVAKGITSSLPEIGSDLSEFMINATPFIEGAKKIDMGVLAGVAALTGIILAITATNVISGITSWITGGSSIAKFSEELPVLGRGLSAFSDSVAGVSVENVIAATRAAKALAQMASTIPNEGGVVSWFTGENSISKFADELPTLGKGLKGFSDSLSGINAENITAAANAAKAITSMANTIPNEGGVVSWFAGDNSIAKFSEGLISLGEGLSGFSTSVAGLNVEQVMAATTAAKSLAEITNIIPNEGGMVAWFTGDNSLSKFASDLPALGSGLLAFSTSVAGIDSENAMAAANVARSIAEMVSIIPNEGGMVAWFTGDNSLSKFASHFPALGEGLKGFSDAVSGINAENVIAATSAAKTIAEMASIIPNEGGVVSWFAGDNSLSKFADQFPALGDGLKAFSDSVTGINPENVTAASNAAKTLAELTSIIPNSGGVVAWFTGESSISKFAGDLANLGKGLLLFSISTVGINAESITAAANAAKSLAELTNILPNSGGVVAWFTGESSISKFAGELSNLGSGLSAFSVSVTGINIESITAAANAAKSLAELTQYVPNSGGVTQWFTGEQSISKFAGELPVLGDGLKGFSTSVEGIVPGNITAAANAAKALAEMTKTIPSSGGIKQWFEGESSISKFAGKLPELGKGLKGFSDSVAGINPANVTAAANAAKSVAQMTKSAPADSDKLKSFGHNLVTFGVCLKSYLTEIGAISKESISVSGEAIEAVGKAAKVNSGSVTSLSNAIDDLAEALKNLADIPSDIASKFKDAMKELGETSINTLVKAIGDSKSKMKKAGEEAMNSLIDGLNSKKTKVKTTGTDIAKACATAISLKSSAFKTAGKALGQGLADGIGSKKSTVLTKVREMADSAIEAAKKKLKINSPSKIFRAIGYSVPEGFAMGIDRLTTMVSSSAVTMSDTAISEVSSSIANIAAMANSDIEAQPTIRPVLDLSDVRSGAADISSIFGGRSSIDVLTNVGAISSMMNSSQNGTNDDVVSAIGMLRKDLANFDRPNNIINGVTYDDGSNISDAVESLVRAARIERRS